MPTLFSVTLYILLYLALIRRALFHPKLFIRCVKVGYVECAAPPARSLVIPPVTNNLSRSVRDVSGNPTLFLHTEMHRNASDPSRPVGALLHNQSELIISLGQIGCILSAVILFRLIYVYLVFVRVCIIPNIFFFVRLKCIFVW